MKPFRLCRTVVLLAMSATGWASDVVTIAPAPTDEELSDEFEVKVETRSVPVYRCRVCAVPLNQVWPSQDDQRGTVRNVVFKDIAVTSRVSPASRLQGFDADHGVDGVVFENVRFNGQAVTNAAAGQIAIGAHVRDVKFIVPAALRNTP